MEKSFFPVKAQATVLDITGDMATVRLRDNSIFYPHTDNIALKEDVEEMLELFREAAKK